LKTLVTGGAGFIGSHIADLLVSEGHDVAVVDSLLGGSRANVPPRARFHQVDIRAPELRDVLAAERPEVVFHEAAQMSVKVSTDRPIYDAEVNVLGLLNLLEACVATGVRKVVFASSGATYGNPTYLPMDEDHPQLPGAPYGITKMVTEHYLRYYAQDHGLQYTSLRYGNVYGPRQDAHGEAGVVAIFTSQLLAGKVPTIHWDGEQVRDYVHVSDVAQANLAAATAGDGRCYCIATRVGTSVNQLYNLLTQALEIRIEPQRSDRRAGDLRAAYFDTSRARDELGWQARIPLREGIADTVEAFRRDFDQHPTTAPTSSAAA
jgi:UDP-glucose 4-epimerase